MRPAHHVRGGAAVAALDRMDAWEVNLVLSLRRWCEGPSGQSRARRQYTGALPRAEADIAWHRFEGLLNKIIGTASRPLVRHDVDCNCVGSDECVFVHLVRTASDGHLNDAALIATLLSGPAHAEHIAVLAGEVGSAIRATQTNTTTQPNADARNIVRLH